MSKLIKILFIVVLILVVVLLARKLFQEKERWEFVGYQYKWNHDYVDNPDLKTEGACVSYGNEWLKKQNPPDALFTCSTGCKDAGLGNGMGVCNKICEYGKTGLIQCRR